MKSRFLGGICAFAVGATLLAGASAVRAEIVIGASLAITGGASFLGDPEAKTLSMLVDEVNAKGGINGERVRLVIYDDGGNPNRAKTFATRLVEEDKIVAAIAGSTTPATMAMIPVFESAEIPLISLASAITIVEPVKKFVFKTPETDLMACRKIFADIVRLKIDGVALISSNGGTGASMRQQCKIAAEEAKVRVVADETYEDSDADMTPQLTRIRSAAGVGAIINPGFGHSSAVVTRGYAQLGMKTPFYQSHGVASDDFLKLTGAAAEGIRLPASVLLVAELLPANDPQKAVAVEFKRAYEGKYKEPVSSYAGYARDAFAILTGAIERAGKSASPAKIRDQIEATKGLVATTGIVTMTPADHMGLGDTSFRMIQVKNGRWALLDD